MFSLSVLELLLNIHKKKAWVLPERYIKTIIIIESLYKRSNFQSTFLISVKEMTANIEVLAERKGRVWAEKCKGK